MIWLPLSGAISEAAGAILEKKILKKHKVDYKNYTVFSFGSIVLIMLSLIYFFWKVSPEAFSTKNLLIFAFVVVSSIIANLLIFYSLKRETVTELEPIRLMQPLFTILLAVMLFSSERKLSITLLALIASISLIAAHVKKHHLVFDKYIIAALLGSLFFAIELVASKFILDYYNPFTFYFLRCLFIFIITIIIFHPKFSSILWLFYIRSGFHNHLVHTCSDFYIFICKNFPEGKNKYSSDNLCAYNCGLRCCGYNFARGIKSIKSKKP